MWIFQGSFQVQKGNALLSKRACESKRLSKQGGRLLSCTRIIGPLVSNEVCMYGSKKETRYPTAKAWESLMHYARWRIFLDGTLLANGGLRHWLTVK